MSDRKTAVLVPIVIMTALALLNGCATTPLMLAVREGDVSMAKKYIDGGADVEGGPLSERPLHIAVRRGNLQMVILLVEAGANIEAMDGWFYTPLMIASEAGNVEMVRLLIQSGASVNMSNNFLDGEIRLPNTALMAASKNQQSEVVQLLIESGADALYVGADGYSAGAAASFRGRPSASTISTSPQPSARISGSIFRRSPTTTQVRRDGSIQSRATWLV